MTIVRAAGPPQGRLHERGKAKARSARPQGLAVADRELLKWACDRKEVTRPLRERRVAPFGGNI